MLDGRDACRFSHFVWTAAGLEDLLAATNVSTSDLYCSHDEISCHFSEDLERDNCTNEGLVMANRQCRTTFFSDHGPGVTEFEVCFDGHTYDLPDADGEC